MSEWLDGPGVVEWLEAKGMRPYVFWRSWADKRAWARWKQGGLASVWVLDRILTQEGLELVDVPEHLWRDPPRRGGRKLTYRHPAPLREAVLRRYSQGERICDLSRELGLSPKTIAFWTRKEKTRAGR